MYGLSSMKNIFLPWACIALCLALLPCCSKSTLDGDDGIDFHTDGDADASDVAREDAQEDTTDPEPDVAPDLEPDIAPDLMPDLAPDLTTDPIPDLVPDLVPDTAEDPVPDPVPDFPFDIPFDRIPDWIPDRIPDWRPDRPPDIMPDPTDIVDDETCFGGIVGDPCSAASDCNCVPSSASECLESLAGFITFPGGYCTARCTSPAECGIGANCAELYPGTSYCLKECTRVWNCRMSEGYNCTTIPLSADSRTYCLPDRGADTAE
ncbi:MAG: hypothetical protein ABIJ56_11820 [Pseudomonadota bacterium]